MSKNTLDYRMVLDQLDAGIIVCEVVPEVGVEIRYCTPRFALFLGCAPEALLGNGLAVHAPEVDRLLRQASQQRAPYVVEVLCEATRRYLSMAVAPVGDRYCSVTASDISEEKKRSLRQRSLERISRAILQATGVKEMLRGVLGIMLEIFDCDRAWLLYPCNPDRPQYEVPIMVCRPEFHTPEGLVLPIDAYARQVMTLALNNMLPVPFYATREPFLPPYIVKDHQVKSQLIQALRPKIGEEWVFGIHQCRQEKTWDEDERYLMNQISERITDGLNSLLYFEKMRESEDRLRAVMGASPDLVFVLDEEGRFIERHAMGIALSGSLFDAFARGEFLEDVFTAPVASRVLANIRAALDTQALQVVEYPMETNEGTHWFEGRLNAFDRVVNEQRCVVLISRDITERRKAAEDLRKAQRYIANIIDSMPSLIIGIDPEGRITQLNQLAEKDLGVSRMVALGRPLDDVYPLLRGESGMIMESIRTREIRQELKIPRMLDDGAHIHNITVYPLIANGVQGAVIRVDDVTREHLLEEQLNQSRKMDAIGQLAGGVAHDFNNMLSGILGAAQLLERDKNLSENSRQYVALIIATAERTSELTGKLLAFSRKGRVASTTINVAGILHDVVALLGRSLDKCVRISLNEFAPSALIVGDDSQLHSVFLNLGINAAQAMPGGGELVFTTRTVSFDQPYCDQSPFDIAPGSFLEVEVRDSGSGISDTDLPRIFEPFFTTKGPREGTGLGLATVYGIVKGHRGAISVSSELGAGTVFRIFLPLSGEVGVAPPLGEELVAGTGLILLVDDEEIIRVTAQAMLRELGYEVILAENGRRALEVYRERSAEISLVVLDMIMPEMNGREAFTQFRQIRPDCRIVIASGFSKEEDLEEMKELGLSGFIRKPWRISELSQVVAAALDGDEEDGKGPVIG